MIIAIAGVSQAGKSTLAGSLRSVLRTSCTTILCQDDFVRDPEAIPTINDHIDWEHPDSIDHERFRQAILAEGQRNQYLIVEGLMVLWDSETRRLFDKCIFIEIDKPTFLERKSADDRWGIEPEWYVEHIWNSYLRFGYNPGSQDCLVVNGCQSIDLQQIITYLDQ